MVSLSEACKKLHWLKLDSAWTLLQHESIFKWLFITSPLLSYCNRTFSESFLLHESQKSVLSHIQWAKPQSSLNFHFTLLFASLFIALLYQVVTQLRSLFQVLILHVSCSPPYYLPTRIFHRPAVISVLPQPLIHILFSILSFLHYHKMSCFPFPKCFCARNPFTLTQWKKQGKKKNQSLLFKWVLQLLNLWRRVGESRGVLFGFSF